MEAGQGDATMMKELSHPLGVAVEVSVGYGPPPTPESIELARFY